MRPYGHSSNENEASPYFVAEELKSLLWLEIGVFICSTKLHFWELTHKNFCGWKNGAA